MKSNLYFCGVSDIKSFIKKLILGLVNIIVTTRVFTIEHSNHQGDEFASILESNHIVMLVDVRRYPSSKSFTQFNKEILAKEFLTNNIYYEHIEKLGGRRNKIAIPQKYDNAGWQKKSFRSFAYYMLTKSFKEGIEKLLSLNFIMRKYICKSLKIGQVEYYHIIYH